MSNERTDTERLDWLARNGQAARQWKCASHTLIRWHGGKHERLKTMRREIDAAMAAQSLPAPKSDFMKGLL